MNKWHKANHHTDATAGNPDSSHDPIASDAHPFQGDFVVASPGTISATQVATNTIIPYTGDWTDIPGNLRVTNLSALTATVNWMDILITEVSGFVVEGDDTSLVVPESVLVPGINNLTLNHAGLSSTSWATFDGDLQTKNNLWVSGIANLGGIEMAGDIDMNGYSISGIGNNSLAFESAAKIQSENVTGNPGKIRLNSYSYAETISTGTSAYGQYSHAEGENSQALGHASHAEGYLTTASGTYSHAEGTDSVASGVNAHAEGESGTASGENSHAEGERCYAQGRASHAAGRNSRAIHNYTHVWSSYNTPVFTTNSSQFKVSAENGVVLGRNVDIDGDLTVNGNISSTAIIYSNCGNSENWCSVYTTVGSNSANWDSVFSQVQSLSDSWEESTDISYLSAAIDTNISDINAVSADVLEMSGSYLPLAGGTMAGTINMDDSDITAVDEMYVTELKAQAGDRRIYISTQSSANTGVWTDWNADMLDGQHSSYFAPVTSLNSYLSLTGGTMSGNIDMGSQNITNVNILCATEVHTLTAYTTYQDITISELEGFEVDGNISVNGTILSTDSLSAGNDITIYSSPSAIKYTSDVTLIDVVSATQVNEFLKIYVNGAERYVSLYTLPI